MIRPATALLGACVLLHAALATAEPILKPHKYYGPIPQSSLALRVGILGGADNADMIDFFERRVTPPFESTSNDFGNGITVEANYVHKPHPQFGLRLNAAYSRLRSDGTGNYVPQVPGVPESVPLPALRYNREFNVDLIVLEASGVYFFSNAAVNDFQSYAGAGFSVGLPRQSYKETFTDEDTGEPYGNAVDLSEWDVGAGVHAVLGLNYYVTSTFAISGEGRVQLMESSFDRLQTRNEIGELENIRFVVHYTGFVVGVGARWAF
jgi:hypothetical protein